MLSEAELFWVSSEPSGMLSAVDHLPAAMHALSRMVQELSREARSPVSNVVNPAPPTSDVFRAVIRELHEQDMLLNIIILTGFSSCDMQAVSGELRDICEVLELRST